MVAPTGDLVQSGGEIIETRRRLPGDHNAVEESEAAENSTRQSRKRRWRDSSSADTTSQDRKEDDSQIYHSPATSSRAKDPTNNMESPVPWPDHWDCEGKVIADNSRQYTIDWRRIKIPLSDATVIQDEAGDWIISFYPSPVPIELANKGMRDDWEARKARGEKARMENEADRLGHGKCISEGRAGMKTSLPKRRRGRPCKKA